MGLIDWLFGGNKRARIRKYLEELCQELTLEEARLGLAELISGLKINKFYCLDGSRKLNWSKLRRDIEIATNLYVYILGLEGNQVSWKEKGKYRVSLTSAFLKALKARSYQEKFTAMSNFFIDVEDLADRDRMESVITRMQSSIRQ